MHLNGVIRNIVYNPQTRLRDLKRYQVTEFDINHSDSQGIIGFDEQGNDSIGYSVWVSPKRTRSYPFARIYSTYHLPKKITIIPVIKDEGFAGELDRINFITLSWMNLMNVYIILGWYEDAVKSKKPGKITAQRLNAAYIREKIEELHHYHQTALHWNTRHFLADFESVYRRSVSRYEQISIKTGVSIHDPQSNLRVLDSFLDTNGFSIDRFRTATLGASELAAKREVVTIHQSESLGTGDKAHLSLINQLGGEYHLTADEVVIDGDHALIQESKNARAGALPKLGDIQDGLFKLILFSNIDDLWIGTRKLTFSVRLRLTGELAGSLKLPAAENEIDHFSQANGLRQGEQNLIRLLNQETQQNQNLSVEITERS